MITSPLFFSLGLFWMLMGAVAFVVEKGWITKLVYFAIMLIGITVLKDSITAFPVTP